MSMEAPYTQESIRTGDEGSSISTRHIIIGAVVGLIFFILLVALIVWLASNFAPELEAVRDIFIIALALESCIFGVLLTVMLIMLVRLVNMLEFEIKPILEKTNETVGMVRGTSTFVGENVVRPVVKGTAFMAGVRRGLRVLFGDPKKNLPD
ncbi:MAG: hypothetical protein R3248_05005 [Candidatus Promineifilaceae bacterium]|nr:hypothetical protein [Candidatus Promineifilaceae bacterium]